MLLCQVASYQSRTNSCSEPAQSPRRSEKKPGVPRIRATPPHNLLNRSAWGRGTRVHMCPGLWPLMCAGVIRNRRFLAFGLSILVYCCIRNEYVQEGIETRLSGVQGNIVPKSVRRQIGSAQQQSYAFTTATAGILLRRPCVQDGQHAFCTFGPVRILSWVVAASVFPPRRTHRPHHNLLQSP